MRPALSKTIGVSVTSAGLVGTEYLVYENFFGNTIEKFLKTTEFELLNSSENNTEEF